MPRQARQRYSQAIYHATGRAVDGRLLFVDEIDRQRFLIFLAAVTLEFRWIVHAYCLMGTHYHLVIETPVDNISQGMQRLNGNYARRYNDRHDLRGHVFGRRYWSLVVERGPHFLELCRYVVLNPVRAGLCGTAEDWPWSSFAATATPGTDRIVSPQTVLAYFGGSAERYCVFVADTDASPRRSSRAPTRVAMPP